MRRVLMIHYYFPPLGGIGSLRALRFTRYLPEFGWEPWVIAPAKGAYHEDASLAYPADRVVRTRSLRFGRASVTRAGGAAVVDAANTDRSVLGLARRFVHRWVYRPDPQITWYPFAVLAGRRLLEQQPFDAVFSSSFPITAHLIGRRLAREAGLPWVADFRDLWSDWGFHADSPARQHADEACERSLLADALAVTTVSPTCAEVLTGRGARQVSVITNAFDPEDFAVDAVPREDVITYLGTYYPGLQDMETALRAVADLKRTGRLAGTRLRFVGEKPPGLDQILAETGLAASTEHTGFVPHPVAMRHVLSSRLLLLPGPISEHPRIKSMCAAKAFEYIGSGRPILCIATPEGDLVKLLAPLPGVRVSAPGDVAAARHAIEELLEDGGIRTASSMSHLTSERLAGDLARILDGVAR